MANGNNVRDVIIAIIAHVISADTHSLGWFVAMSIHALIVSRGSPLVH